MEATGYGVHDKAFKGHCGCKPARERENVAVSVWPVVRDPWSISGLLRSIGDLIGRLCNG